MKGTKVIAIAVCFMLTAISMNAQEQKYELSEAKVAPGFYLAPNGYEYQLPQYGLTITIPKQSYYKVPYLLKHNAYLITNDSIVSYSLYKFYLNNSYTDFALFGSYTGNMRYRVAELKNNDEKEFLAELRKKTDYKNLRSLRTPFATFTHYSALNEGRERRIHGYYYLANNILIEFIVTPEKESELTKYEGIIKTLRKADLQKDLNEYLTMLSALKSTVVDEEIELDLKKDEEEVEVLYAQELTTPTIAPQPSLFAEPTPKNNPVNAEAAKNTSELAALLRASRGDMQAEEKNIEVTPVTITEPTELVVFKGGYIKPPAIEWHFDIQPQQLPVFNLAMAQQNPIRLIERNLLPIYSMVKRPDVVLDIAPAPLQPLVATNNFQSIYPVSTAKIEKSLLAIAPVAKRPDIALEVDNIVQNDVATNPTKDLAAITNAEKTLAVTPIEKRPDVSVDVDVAKSELRLADNSVSLDTSTTTAERTLVSTITPVEKRPDISVNVEVANTEGLSIDITNISSSPSTVGTTLASSIEPVIKQPELTLEIGDIKPLTMAVSPSNLPHLASSSSAGLKQLLAIREVKKRPVSSEIKVAAVPTTNIATQSPAQKVAENTTAPEAQIVAEAVKTDPSAFVVTEEIAEEYWNKTQEVSETIQPKFIDLSAPPVMEERGVRRRPQPTIVDKIEYGDLTAVEAKKEVAVGIASVASSTEELANVSAAAENSQEQEVSNKRERCYRSSEISIAKTEEPVMPYSRVQQKPTFNGGDYNSFALWVGDNMCYPAGLRQELNGYVTVEIVITSDGSIANVNVMSAPHRLLETEVRYMLSTSPKWTPGAQDGNPVAVSVVVGVPVSAYL